MIGNAIKFARKRAALSQADLAANAAVSRQALCALENEAGSMSTLNSVIGALEDFRLSGIASGLTIAQQVFNRRQRLGWTQEQVARRAGLSVPTVRALERGQGNVASLNKVLAEIAPSARLRAPPRAHWSSAPRDHQFTPPLLVRHIVEALGPIELDPCGHPSSFVGAARTYTEADCGLRSSWAGANFVFCNPPYSQLVRWIDRCHQAWTTGEVNTVLGLFPTRLDSAAFHERILGVADLLLLKGRIKFFDSAGKEGNQAPFSLMFAIWGGKSEEIDRLRNLVPCAHIPPQGAFSVVES